MKIGHNSLCPCGSGRKYKKCCLNDPFASHIGQSIKDHEIRAVPLPSTTSPNSLEAAPMRQWDDDVDNLSPITMLEINYLIVKGHSPAKATILKTNGMEHLVPDFFFLPRNLIQLFDPMLYASASAAASCLEPNGGRSVFVDGTQTNTQVSYYLETIAHAFPVHIVLFTEWSEPIYNLLRSKAYANKVPVFLFFETPAMPDDIKKHPLTITTPYMLAETLRSCIPDIIAWLENRHGFLPTVYKELFLGSIPKCEDFDIPDFAVTHTLWGLINQYTGQVWRQNLSTVPHDRQKRSEYIFDALWKCDGLANHIDYSKYNAEPTAPILPPLFMAFPYVPSAWRKALSAVDLDLGKCLALEQDMNYIHTGKEKGIEKEKYASVLGALKLIRSESDFIGYLHSTLSWSPVIRFPEIGISIASEISALTLKNQPRTGPDAKTIKSISAFGKKLAELTLSKKIRDHMLEYNRQLIFHSDLPIEWLEIDSIPISFLFDVCRIPYSPSSCGLSEYAQNSQKNYQITKETFSNHLVVSASPDDENMKSINRLIDESYAQKGIPLNRMECRSVSELASIIQNKKPELLIIDSHGNYNHRTGESYIMVGKERLGREQIMEHNISAPLVILSCCSTAPIHCWNPVSNWFLETGAISVLSTMLPIQVRQGAVLYSRILQNLYNASDLGVHKNWLSFVAHNIRTSVLGNSIVSVAEKFNAEPSTVLPQIEWLANSMMFYKRRECFERIYDTVADMFPNLERQQVICFLRNHMCQEHLFYTLHGRADLVVFDVWRQTFLQNMHKDMKLDKH